jgi:serine/threonine protein kinase
VQPGETGHESPSAGFKKPAIADYELIRLIGHGSYGDVWLARGITGSFCALKIIWRDRFSDPRPFDREFRGLREFAAMSRVDLAQMSVLHIGRSDAEGFFFYAMELADDAERGREIDPASYVPNTLREMRSRRGRLPPAEVVTIGIAVARALAGLHARDLVHRDIKPSNIILVGGTAKLADIGLVAPAASMQTYVGTEGFMPPEGPGAFTADVFGLGILLYELATGLDRREFPRLPEGLGTLPDRKALLALNEVLVAACDPDPKVRPADASAFLRLLVPLLAQPPGGRTLLGRPRWGWLAAGVVVLVVAAVLLAQWRKAAAAILP